MFQKSFKYMAILELLWPLCSMDCTVFAILQKAIVKKIVSEHDQDRPHSQIAEKPVVLQGRATQHSGDTKKKNKAKQPGIFPLQDHCKTSIGH